MQVCDYLKITFGEFEELLNEVREYLKNLNNNQKGEWKQMSRKTKEVLGMIAFEVEIITLLVCAFMIWQYKKIKRKGGKLYENRGGNTKGN